MIPVLCAGIGYALAREFLKAGDNVLICSRSGIELQLRKQTYIDSGSRYI